MKFRKKPVVIEAHEWDGDAGTLAAWVKRVSDDNGKYIFFQYDYDKSILYVRTIEGQMAATIGDMIICGVEGEFYFCKPDIFYKTYEFVE